MRDIADGTAKIGYGTSCEAALFKCTLLGLSHHLQGFPWSVFLLMRYLLPALTSVYLVQLAMHSIREMCAVDDCSHAYHHFVSFFEDFSALDASIDVDSLGDAEIEGTYSEVPCNHVH